MNQQQVLLTTNENSNEHSEPIDGIQPSINKLNVQGAKENDRYRKVTFGIFIVIGIAVSWTGSTQFAQSIETNESFNCPFALMWWSTSFKTLCIIPIVINNWLNKDHNSVNKNKSAIHKVYPFSKESAIRYIYLYTLWALANYCYIRALYDISATLVTALFSSAPAFVYIFSIFLLDQQYQSYIKLIAVLLCIGGILMIALSDTDYDFALVGCILSVFSAICAALYKVSFKRFYGDMHILKVCQFLSWLGLFNMAFMWVIIVILDVSDAEKLPNNNVSHWPWLYLLGSGLLGLSFDFFINFGIAFTYPLFISLGTIIGIPLNLVVDMIIHHTKFSALQLFGAFTICVGFMVMILSDLRICNKKKKDISEE